MVLPAVGSSASLFQEQRILIAQNTTDEIILLPAKVRLKERHDFIDSMPASFF
jgi:hypothetical protein